MKKIYSAKFLLPIAAPQIEDGAIAIDDERIVAVGTRDDVVRLYPNASVEDFGEACIAPGFVNCHTHLELTALRGFLEDVESDFFAWLRKLTLARMERMTTDDLYVSAAWGACEALRAGVTCVGDASDAGAQSLAAVRDAGLRGVIFQEIFGPDARIADEQLSKLREKIGRLREIETKLARVGVSPHAPYTVSAPLIQKTAQFALDEALPLMMHAAESKAEELFMHEGAGAFAEGLRKRGIECTARGCSTIKYLNEIGFLAARPLLAHCIRVDADDIALIKKNGAGVAHCPKSNAKLGHGRAPFAEFLKNDVRVGFGSDSVASNNANDMLEEARFAALLARAAGDKLCAADGKTNAAFDEKRTVKNESPRMINADDVIQVLTLGGARAMGIENEVGSLEAGKQADFVAVNLTGAHQLPVYDAASALVFSSTGRDVRLTVIAGREVYRDNQVLTLDEERLRARIDEIKRKLLA